MSFVIIQSNPETLNKVYLEAAHGVRNKEPIYGGKKYLEKQEYIIEKLNADIKDLYDTIDTWQEIGEKLQAENERLTQENKNLELKIEDVEGLLKEVSLVAYDKACDTIVDEITDKVREEDLAEIEDHKKWLMSPERKAPKNLSDYSAISAHGLLCVQRTLFSV